MAAESNWHIIYGTKYSAADVGPGHAALASLVRYTNRHTGEIALSGNNPGQVVYTRLASVAKQYNLVLVKVR